jgi:hypothetical protein
MPTTFLKVTLACGRSMFLSVFLSILLSIGLVALPEAALAKGSFSSDGRVPVVTLPDKNPDHFSAGDQYVETVPTPKGPKATDDKGKGRGVKRTLALPREIRKRIDQQGGGSARKLIELATSPQLGAPSKGGHKRSGSSRHHTSRSAPAVPSAAIDAVGGGEAGLGWLVLAVLTITALALGAVGYRRYRDKDASS